MPETKVPAPRLGDDIVRAVFSHVKTWSTGNEVVHVGAGTLVGADDGSDSLEVLANLAIDGTVTGVDGLDTGVFTTNTWYYVWLIKAFGGAVHGLLSASATSPTMPGGYQVKRRVGAARSVSGSALRKYRQAGQWVTYSDAVEIYDVSPMPVTTPVSVSLTAEAPPTVLSGRFQTRGPGTDTDLYIGYESGSLHFVGDSGTNHSDRQLGDGHATLVLTGQAVWLYRNGIKPDENHVTVWLSGYEDNLS